MRQDWSGVSGGYTALPGIKPTTPLSGKDAILMQAMRGGYPEVLTLGDKAVRRWHQDYLAALMARDLQDITHIRRKDSMSKLLEVLAAWSCKLMDISAIGGQLTLARPTLESYINALEALVFGRTAAALGQNRLRARQPARQVGDDWHTRPGAASLLRWQFEKVRMDADQSGKLVEGFLFSDWLRSWTRKAMRTA